jgi:anti-anti-sigma factor
MERSNGMTAEMITSAAGNGPARLAAEGGAAVTGSGRPAVAGPRLRMPAPGARTEATGRSQRTLTLAGNLDVATDETVRDRAARCLRDQPDVLIVDMRELNFCDDTGVRALRWVLRRAALVGATVRIIPPGEHLRRVLTQLGANDLLAVIDCAGPARASKAPGPR